LIGIRKNRQKTTIFILEILKEQPLTLKQIIKKTKKKESQIRSILSELQMKKKVFKQNIFIERIQVLHTYWFLTGQVVNKEEIEHNIPFESYFDNNFNFNKK